MTETELKFQVPPECAARLERAVATASAQTTRLQAVYADTADRRLAAHMMALRLRKEGRVWVQTLKGRGDGLMNRLEHEVQLPPQRGTPVLNVQRHAGTAVGDRLIALLGGEPLLPLYSTDIRRLHRVLRFHGARVEVAYDRGWLISGAGAARRRLAVNEIEFELKGGSPHAFVGLAMIWLIRHGLWWDCRTKSERGLRLALGIEQVPATPAPPARPVRGFAGWQAALGLALAHALPNAAELADGLGTAEHQRELGLALKRLRAVLRMDSAGPYDWPALQHENLLGQWLEQAGQDQRPWPVRDVGFATILLNVLILSLPLATSGG